MAELLIDVVKRYQAVYNTNCIEYRDCASRQAAWESIAELCGSTVEECKESWSKLRNCYTNAKKRRIRRSGHKFDPWRYEKEMAFLDHYVKERPVQEKEADLFVEDTWERGSNAKASSTNRITASLEKEHLLIELIRRYEVIYNTKCNEYRDAKERNAAWVEIADLHGSTVAQCKETWIKLRNCYTNSIKRQQIKSAKKMPTTPWRFEKEMAFLRPHLNLRFNVPLDTALSYEDEDSWEANLSPRGMHSPESDVPTHSPHKRKASTANLFEEVDVAENFPELLYENQTLDDIDHFFLSMSKMTKKLPKIDQLRIKLNLHKAINEAELNQLQQTEDGGVTKDNDHIEDTGTIEGVKQEVLSPRRLSIEECQKQEFDYLSYD